MDNIFAREDIESLHKVYGNRLRTSPSFLREVSEIAAENDLLDIMRYLDQNYNINRMRLVNIALEAGSYEVIRYLRGEEIVDYGYEQDIIRDDDFKH